MQASSRRADRRRARRRTRTAIVLLLYARLLIALVPLRLWRGRLGLAMSTTDGGEALTTARRLADHVERAASLMPATMKCLPRAMALSMMLRHERIGHELAFAVRPRGHAGAAERLHAWVRRGDAILIGDEPGPWIEVFAIGAA